MAARPRAWRIVNGHGDVLTGAIFYLDDGPRVLDWLEFDDRLRYVDGLDDAAFLAMDLEYRGASQGGCAARSTRLAWPCARPSRRGTHVRSGASVSAWALRVSICEVALAPVTLTDLPQALGTRPTATSAMVYRLVHAGLCAARWTHRIVDASS